MTSLRFSTVVLAGAVSLAVGRAIPAKDLQLDFEMRALPADSTPVVELRLTLPPSADSVRMLRLPRDWAGFTSLHRGILGLDAVTPGARVETTADSSLRRLIAPAGRPVTIRWLRRPSWQKQMPPGSHNVSDFGPDWFQLVGYDALVLPDLDHSTLVRASFAFHAIPTGATVATSFGSGNRRADTLVRILAPLGSLLHSVYVAAATPTAVRLVRIPVRGHPVDVAVRGALRIPDSVLVAGVRRVVGAERGFWKDPGSPTYLVSIGEAARGTLAGVRLTNAFVADIDPARPAFDDPVLMLLGHELMHEWIGGLLHHGPAVPDGHLMWFSEGFTDYATANVLFHTGVLSDSSYLTIVNGWLHEYAMSPARDLSWPEVEQRHWSNPDIQRQPYLRGALLALRLDALARARNPKSSTVGVALRDMLDAGHGAPVIVSEVSIIRALSPLIGSTQAEAEVAGIMKGGARLSIPNDLLGPCYAQHDVDEPRWDPGFDLDGSVQARTIRGVRGGSHAAQAGLADGMQLRGLSVYRGDLAKPIELRVRAPGDTTNRQLSFSAVGDSTIRVTVVEEKKGAHAQGSRMCP